jgi:hypothetical protein
MFASESAAWDGGFGLLELRFQPLCSASVTLPGSDWTFFCNLASISTVSIRESRSHYYTPAKQRNMNIKSVVAGALLIAQISTSDGQTNSFIVAHGITLPKDSTTQSQLLTALNGFLSQKEKPAKENTYLLKTHLLETSALLAEMKHIEENIELKQPDFYKCYLTNVMPLNENDYLIQCSYIGISETTPVLRASFTIVATKNSNQFHFSSPLKRNSHSWKAEVVGNTTFHFKTTLNSANAKVYLGKIAEYDKRLKAPSQPAEFYCCDTFHEVLQLIGVDYKADYNGYSHNSLSTIENNTDLVVDGTLTSDLTKFDPHDLWHDRLRRVVSPDIINRPVDEGCAYLYGGSWGVMSWKDVLGKFKAYAVANENADWLALYNDSRKFDEKDVHPLRVDFAVNALFVQKIEREKGFAAVMELLSCGKKEADNANYFKALEKITGISKSNFSSRVVGLIKEN